MRAMILAAGRGGRMEELTLSTPKPLLKIGDRYLIDFAIKQIVEAGIKEIVINISYQAAKIREVLGNGERYGANIIYSEESERLETGGGILKALPLLGKEKFLVVSADVISNYPIKRLLAMEVSDLAHLVLVPNPPFHPNGDFGLKAGLLNMESNPFYTFANIGIYHADLFTDCKSSYFPLSQLLFPAVAKQKITGEIFTGTWFNVGTKAELEIVRNFLLIHPLTH